MSPARTRCLAKALCAVTASAMALLQAHAADEGPAAGKLTVDGSVTLGSAYRTVAQDAELLPNLNSSLVGIPGGALTPSAGRNQDDGNLNFNRGNPVSQVLNGYLASWGIDTHQGLSAAPHLDWKTVVLEPCRHQRAT